MSIGVDHSPLIGAQSTSLSLAMPARQGPEPRNVAQQLRDSTRGQFLALINVSGPGQCTCHLCIRYDSPPMSRVAQNQPLVSLENSANSPIADQIRECSFHGPPSPSFVMASFANSFCCTTSVLPVHKPLSRDSLGAKYGATSASPKLNSDPARSPIRACLPPLQPGRTEADSLLLVGRSFPPVR